MQFRFEDIWRYSCAGKVFQEFLMGFLMIGCGLVPEFRQVNYLSPEGEDLEIGFPKPKRNLGNQRGNEHIFVQTCVVKEAPAPDQTLAGENEKKQLRE